MRPAPVWALPALIVVGCGLSEESYRQAFAEANCERSSECSVEAGGAPRDCTSVSAPASTLFTCDFDADAAGDCLDAVPSAPCAGTTAQQPPVCSTVLTNCSS